MSRNEKFQQLMTMVGANYNKKLGEDNITLFATMAKNWGFDEFYNAMMAHMSDPDTGMYFPNMAHISKHIQGTSKERDQNLESKAQFQWMQVDRAMRNLGSYTTPKFQDPITSAAISVMGGWVGLCASTTDQLVWKQKEFVRNYLDFTNKPIEQLPNHIQGREDLQLLKADDKKTLTHIMDQIGIRK